ncbi:MAG TPA: response regulator transcription factor [Dehalococcoidia bacterium]
MSEHVLVIDDDPASLHALRDRLQRHGYAVTASASGQEGLRLALERRPDVVILGLELAGLDGVELCRRLREFVRVPICVLSGRARPDDVVRGLSAGADVYLTKPCAEPELLARIRALLRRAGMPGPAPSGEPVRVGDLEINLEARQVRKRGRPVDLSPMEFRLLALLARNCGKVQPHRRILAEVWGPEYVDDTQYLRIYVRYLREKLEDDPDEPRYILTEWGVGYRLADPEEERTATALLHVRG